MIEHKQRHAYKGNGFGIIIKKPNDMSGTLTSFIEKTQALEVDMKIRKLTPLECERLQGFPDNWTKGVSDTQRYRQMGNAVTVDVVEYLAKHLKIY
jgi:site-specific DNA-cytosine methylase